MYVVGGRLVEVQSFAPELLDMVELETSEGAKMMAKCTLPLAVLKPCARQTPMING